MAIITISLPDKLLSELDKQIIRLGYSSRSEYLRELITSSLEKSEKPYRYRLTAVLSNHEKYPRVDEKIMATAYRTADNLLALYHQILSREECITIIVMEESDTATLLTSSLRRIKGVEKVWTIRF
jgi:metal-responsive CopG/Arc/MetJ family transcriptional regulator